MINPGSDVQKLTLGMASLPLLLRTPIVNTVPATKYTTAIARTLCDMNNNWEKRLKTCYIIIAYFTILVIFVTNAVQRLYKGCFLRFKNIWEIFTLYLPAYLI